MLYYITVATYAARTSYIGGRYVYSWTSKSVKISSSLTYTNVFLVLCDTQRINFKRVYLTKKWTLTIGCTLLCITQINFLPCSIFHFSYNCKQKCHQPHIITNETQYKSACTNWVFLLSNLKLPCCSVKGKLVVSFFFYFFFCWNGYDIIPPSKFHFLLLKF